MGFAQSDVVTCAKELLQKKLETTEQIFRDFRDAVGKMEREPLKFWWWQRRNQLKAIDEYKGILRAAKDKINKLQEIEQDLSVLDMCEVLPLLKEELQNIRNSLNKFKSEQYLLLEMEWIEEKIYFIINNFVHDSRVCPKHSQPKDRDYTHDLPISIEQTGFGKWRGDEA